MAVDITMPKLSDTMTEGRLISWKKSVGEQVHRGEIIAEVETDKANMEVEAAADGVLRKVLYQEGEVVPVLTTVAVIAALSACGGGGDVDGGTLHIEVNLSWSTPRIQWKRGSAWTSSDVCGSRV